MSFLNTSSSLPRRTFFSKAYTALFGLAIAGGAVAAPSSADAATKIPASAQKKCATCQYWGGVRKVSKDGETVTADGKGWCNNPDSPAYQKKTKPDQGAPVWEKWSVLG